MKVLDWGGPRLRILWTDGIGVGDCAAQLSDFAAFGTIPR